MRALVVFPHGLGDFIHLSGVFREFKRQNPAVSLYFAVTPYAIESGLFCRYDFVSGVLPVENPYSGYLIGPKLNQVKNLRMHAGVFFERVYEIHLRRQAGHTAISDTMNQLGLKCTTEDCHPFFTIMPEERRLASQYLELRGVSKGRYNFYHLHSSDIRKNVSSQALSGTVDISIDRHYLRYGFPIGVSAAIMSGASKNRTRRLCPLPHSLLVRAQCQQSIPY